MIIIEPKFALLLTNVIQDSPRDISEGDKSLQSSRIRAQGVVTSKTYLSSFFRHTECKKECQPEASCTFPNCQMFLFACNNTMYCTVMYSNSTIPLRSTNDNEINYVQEIIEECLRTA